MPRGDRSGPDGMGPMSGRGLGYCAGSERPGFMANEGPRGGAGYGRGRGFGRRGGGGFGYGRGRGFGRGWNSPSYAEPMYDASSIEDQGEQGLDLAQELVSLKEVIRDLAKQIADMGTTQ